MQKAVDHFADLIRCIRGGNVSTAIVDSVKIPYYGQMVPIKQIATTSKSDKIITIDPYDITLVGIIVTSLQSLHLNAYAFSKSRIVVSIPTPTLEERKKIIAHINTLAEEAKISIRNIRKVMRQQLDKNSLKEQDGAIQKETDLYIKMIEKLLNDKISQIC